MKLDTLYKRSKTGAIVFWSIETFDDDGTIVIQKTTGQLGTTSPTIHRENVTAGKQKRSVQEQAEFMAISDWKKKRDEGYKALTDVGIHDISSMSIKEHLELHLPKFNTDSSGNVKPMLAKDWNKGKGVKFPCYIQPKLDGVRCLMVCGDESIVFLSRSGKPYTTLNHIAETVLGTIKNVILDGEIYSDELGFQEIVAAVKKQRPDSLKLHFRAYDVVNEEIQLYRLDTMRKIVRTINSSFITDVETWNCYHADDTEGSGVKWYHNKWVQAGYEGAMLRMHNGTYGQGQRSSHLLKVKEYDETEFEFIRFEVGQRPEDLLAVCRTKEGAQVKATMNGTKEQKAYLRANEPPLGSLLTVKHFGWTDDKIPRHPNGKGFRLPEDL